MQFDVIMALSFPPSLKIKCVFAEDSFDENLTYNLVLLQSNLSET